jgi:hypothetical protein
MGAGRETVAACPQLACCSRVLQRFRGTAGTPRGDQSSALKVAMGFYVYDRMGGQDRYGDNADINSVVAGLLDQLQEDPEDQEHTEVSVHHGDWYVAAHVSGVLKLGNSSWIKSGSKRKAIPPLYLRASRKAEVARLLKLMANGDIETIRKAKWVSKDQLPGGKKALFR